MSSVFRNILETLKINTQFLAETKDYKKIFRKSPIVLPSMSIHFLVKRASCTEVSLTEGGWEFSSVSGIFHLELPTPAGLMGYSTESVTPPHTPGGYP